MEEQNIPQETETHTPDRPIWQRIGALLCVIILIVGFLLYCRHIAIGGI